MSQNSEEDGEAKINITPLLKLQEHESSKSLMESQKTLRVNANASRMNSTPLNFNVVKKRRTNIDVGKPSTKVIQENMDTSRKRSKSGLKSKLDSKTGEKQGNIRRYFIPIKKESENKPVNFQGVETVDLDKRTLDFNPQTEQTSTTVDMLVNVSEHENMMTTDFTEIVDEPDLMDSTHSENGETVSKSEEFFSNIIITNVCSVQASSELNTKVNPDLNVDKNDQELNNSEFQNTRDVDIRNTDVATAVLTSESPNFKRKNSTTLQIDEISSTQHKRARVNSCSSSSSWSSAKTTKGSENMDITTAFEKKNWNRIFKILTLDLKNNIFPSPSQLGIVIASCLLKMNGRVSHKSQSLASDYFEHFEEMTTGKEAELMLSALEQVEPYSKKNDNCYWITLNKIFKEMISEAESRLAKRVSLSFLQHLYLIVSKSYEIYLKQKVKLKLPIIARIFGGLDCSDEINLIINFKKLLRITFQLRDFSDELKICLDWINIFTSHFYDYNRNDDIKMSLVTVFVDVVKDKEQKDYGLFLLRRLTKTVYVENVILQLVYQEFPEIQLHPKVTRKEFLAEMSNTSRVTDHDIHENMLGNPTRSSGKGIQKKSYKLKDDDPWEYTNQKGETKLHVYCDKSKRHLFKDLEARIAKMKQEGIGDINVLDNSGNSILHEASWNERDDVIHLLWTTLYNPKEEPGPHNVNIFAKNDSGNTPLHLCVEKGFKTCTQNLVSMCSADKEKLHRLLQIKNKKGESPIDICHPSIKRYLEKSMPIIEEVNFTFAGIELNQPSIDNFKSNVNLQKLIAYWRHLKKTRERI